MWEMKNKTWLSCPQKIKASPSNQGARRDQDGTETSWSEYHQRSFACYLPIWRWSYYGSSSIFIFSTLLWLKVYNTQICWRYIGYNFASNLNYCIFESRLWLRCLHAWILCPMCIVTVGLLQQRQRRKVIRTNAAKAINRRARRPKLTSPEIINKSHQHILQTCFTCLGTLIFRPASFCFQEHSRIITDTIVCA